MKIETRIYDDKTIIPKKYLKKFSLEEEDIVVWEENKEGEIILRFKKNKTPNTI